MRLGRRLRAFRWAGGILAVLLGILILLTIARFVPAYLSDRSLNGKAGYLGTILAAAGILVPLLQFLGGLGHRELPQALAERLQPTIQGDLIRRLGHMRRASEDISLRYRLSGQQSEVPLDRIADALLHEHARAVLVSHPGRGKSYSALQIALEVIRTEPIIIPLVVPLSRWTGSEGITIWLSRYIATEFNVSRSAAQDMIESGKCLAFFDGLDELCITETAVAPAEQFLRKLLEWRQQGAPSPFLLTCRRVTWNAISIDLREQYTLDQYAIMPVGYAEATKYLSRSLGSVNAFRPAVDLAESLQAMGRSSLLSSPWQLSLVAELARDQLNLSSHSPGRDLAFITESADTASLVAKYAESVGVVNAAVPGRLRNVLDLWWLSKYARYLEHNRVEQVTVAGRILPARDIVLHRLWPAAGSKSPLVMDFSICVLLSAPGFFWLSEFLWDRDWIARASLLIGGAIWLALLTRTSTTPWVRPATPDWSRLTDPKFFLRQMGAALVIGGLAWAIAGPWPALVGFITAWLAIGLTVGFGQTLATDTRPDAVGPVGTLRRERTVSRLSAAVVFPALAWGFSLTWGPQLGVSLALAYCLVVGETVASALWRRYIAMILVSAPRLPWAPSRSLERMCSLGFVRVAGISYQFRHDDILRYFAYSHNVREHFRKSLRRTISARR